MKYTNFIKCLLASIPLLSFWGCESEDLPNSGQGELVPVTIRLTTTAPNDVQTRANEHTAELVNNDYTISSLNVYITDGNSTTPLTESDFTFSGSDENYQGTSNSTVELVRGKTYTVYALANTTSDINYQTNSPVDATSMVNSTNNTVPMSAQTTWTIDGGIETIELVRMVAQMQVSIVQDDNKSGTNARTFAISDFKITDLLPATTNLYRERYGSVELPTSVTRNYWTWDSPKIGTENGTAFYLHETNGEFTVSLYDGTRTRSNTFKREIPRNHILPLIIHLSDYYLEFPNSTYQHGPIGVIKNPINIGNYTMELPSGASAVNLNIQLKNADGEAIKDATWVHELTQEGTLPKLNLGELKPDEDGVLSILSDYDFPAGLTGTITLELTATFTDDKGNAQTQKFTVTIRVDKITDEDLTRSASNEAEPIIVEL